MEFLILGWGLAAALALALVLVILLRKKCPACPTACPTAAARCPTFLGMRYTQPADRKTADLLRSAQSLLVSSTKASCRVAKELWAAWREPLVVMLGSSKQAMCSPAERVKIVERMRAQVDRDMRIEGVGYRLTPGEIDAAVTAVIDLLNAVANAACRNGSASGAAVAGTVDNLLAAFCTA